MRTSNEIYIPRNERETWKFVEHEQLVESPTEKSISNFNRKIDAMIAQWMQDYSEIQSRNNIQKGIAVTVELF